MSKRNVYEPKPKNVVSDCYVIFVDSSQPEIHPVIFLTQPEGVPAPWQVFHFSNVFQAKSFIQKWSGNVSVVVAA